MGDLRGGAAARPGGAARWHRGRPGGLVRAGVADGTGDARSLGGARAGDRGIAAQFRLRGGLSPAGLRDQPPDPGAAAPGAAALARRRGSAAGDGVHRRAVRRAARRASAARAGRRAARDRHAATLPQQLLRDVFDQAAATFGIEPRYPFLDRRVVEFCLELPAEQKLARGMTRAIVRRALGDLLPPAVRDRTSKATPARSLMRNLLAHERERLDAAILGEPPPVVREYIDVDALRAAYLAYRERGAGEATWLEVARIWKTAVLAIWLRGDTFAW
ncbi:MAG: asparagine synthase-related protein [Thermomicrobiales bacterium]